MTWSVTFKKPCLQSWHLLSLQCVIPSVGCSAGKEEKAELVSRRFKFIGCRFPKTSFVSSGPAEAVRPLRPWSDQNFRHLRSKSYISKILVGPIIVWSSFSSNGRTNLALLPPLLVFQGSFESVSLNSFQTLSYVMFIKREARTVSCDERWSVLFHFHDVFVRCSWFLCSFYIDIYKTFRVATMFQKPW